VTLYQDKMAAAARRHGAMASASESIAKASSIIARNAGANLTTSGWRQAERLEPGCMVWLPDLPTPQWAMFVGFHEESGVMHVDDGKPFTYRPAVGQSILYQPAPF
jgi:hypothetical protein